MNISKDNISGVKNLPGVNVTSCIVPCTDEDNYATHDSEYGKGGWREVRTIEERDAIPMERRKLGMAVCVTQLNKVYILKYALNNYCWYEFNPSDVEGIINEAIASGNINIDMTQCVTADAMENAIADNLTGYAKKSKVTEDLAELSNNLKQWVEEKNYLTEHQSLEDYATKEEVAEELEELETSIGEALDQATEAAEKVDALEESFNTFEEEANGKFENISTELEAIEESIGGGGGATFATQEALDELAIKEQNDIDTANENITSVATALETIAHNCPSTTEVSNMIANAGFVTKSYLRGFATEFYVQDYVAEAMAGRVRPPQPLVDYEAQINELRGQIEALTARVEELENGD